MRLILTLFLASLILSVSAQDDKEAKAKEILDKVAAKTKSYKTIQTDFISTMENAQEKTKETHKGTISIKGDKYKLLFLNSEIFNDGKTQWTYMKESNEVNITEPKKDDESVLNPSKIATLYQNDFKYKFVGEKFEKARALYEIDLFPKKLDKKYSRITLMIDKDKMNIYSIKYVGKDGGTNTIELIAMKTDVEMSDAMFTFNKANYPKVEIIDTRD